ncbi:MAG: ABC transporter ATP-binding protein [Candidatus Heimdallarchaeum endolithica]|uniref:ABC transporter ATP-binding protein n=1 Tax=Candidatus Heimdallarchaeum endolithica TaxID=2876572 RepID=A0A9Y1BPX9_9ARCH|nr:MAG: ABC transporter ATP-binding protein [Candidatus Heimdallarchaeum endolithica]
MNPIVKVEHLKKSFIVGENEVIAVKDISFSINKGEFVSCVGPSGSGKTTLLNLLGTIEHPTKGTIIIDGEDVTKFSPNELAQFRRRKIGFVFQFFNLIDGLTAYENVELPLIFDYQDYSERRKKVNKLFDDFDLNNLKHKFPEELSSGERQRVAIMRSIVNDPLILLCDEATGNLDSQTGQKILELLKELNEKKSTTILMVTHDLSAAKVAKRTIHMRDGIIERETKRN